MAEVVKGERRVSFWQVFLDDIHLIFFLGIAVFFISYTVWGLVEIGTVAQSTIGAAAQPAPGAVAQPAPGAAAQPAPGAVAQPAPGAADQSPAIK